VSQVLCQACNNLIEVPDDEAATAVECPVCFGWVPTSAPPVAEVVPAAAPAPAGFEVRPFKAPTGGSRAVLVVPMMIGLLAAMVMAVVCAIVGSFFWLVVVFPLLHGAVVGLAVGFAARVSKTRLPGGVGTVGALAALASVFGVQLLDYLAFRTDPGAPRVGFWGFLDHRATEGIQIGKAGAGGGGMNLGYTGTIIYWVVEAAVTMLAAGGVAAAMCVGPFCEACNVWKRKRVLGPYKVEPAAAAAALAAGNPAGIPEVPASGVKAQVTLSLYECPHCGEDAEIDVHLAGARSEGKQTVNYQLFVTYPGEAAAEFDATDRDCRKRGLTNR
jgi:hypothetical protein